LREPHEPLLEIVAPGVRVAGFAVKVLWCEMLVGGTEWGKRKGSGGKGRRRGRGRNMILAWAGGGTRSRAERKHDAQGRNF
jgi:hypothetical protein